MDKIRAYEGKVPAMFLRFYAVGALLFMIPFTRGIFISIISLSLLLVIGAIFLYHRDWNVRTIVWFAFIAISSFLLEMFGVGTGKVFGQYSYAPGLAPLVAGTPLIIGLLWLFLVYASHNVVNRFAALRPWSRVLLGSLLMIVYDLILEWVAPSMRMWHFGGAYAPIQNFVIWFAAALVYQTGFEVLSIKSDNPPARALFGIQMIFFLVIGIYSSIFIS